MPVLLINGFTSSPHKSKIHSMPLRRACAASANSSRQRPHGKDGKRPPSGGTRRPCITAKKGIGLLLLSNSFDQHVGLEFFPVEKRPKIFQRLRDEGAVGELHRRKARLTNLIEHDVNVANHWTGCRQNPANLIFEIALRGYYISGNAIGLSDSPNVRKGLASGGITANHTSTEEGSLGCAN